MTQDQRRLWLKDRQRGIGGTDIATLAGLGFRDRDALAVYEEKTADQVEDNPGLPIMRMGLATEDYNAELYAKRTGARLLKPGIVWSDDVPWAFATLDRVARFPTLDGTIDEVRPAELKYCLFFGDDWGDDGSDIIPDGYLCQTTWQMATLLSRKHHVKRADVSVLSGAGEHRVYSVPFDPKLAAMLLELGAAFWKFVVERVPPIDWQHPLRQQITSRLAEIRPDTSIALDERAQLVADRYAQCKQTAKAAEDEAAACKEHFQMVLAGAAVGTLPDGRRVTQKTVTRKSYTVAEGTYVDFRILNAKKEKKRAE